LDPAFVLWETNTVKLDYLHFEQRYWRSILVESVNLRKCTDQTVLLGVEWLSPIDQQVGHDSVTFVNIVNYFYNLRVNRFIDVSVRCNKGVLGRKNEFEADWSIFVINFYWYFTPQLNAVYFVLAIFSNTYNREVSRTACRYKLR